MTETGQLAWPRSSFRLFHPRVGQIAAPLYAPSFQGASRRGRHSRDACRDGKEKGGKG